MTPVIFRQSLGGLKLGKKVALRGIDDRSIGITLEGFTGRINETDAGINALFDDLSEQTTASGINTAISRLRTAITTKYDLIRERIEASAENEETQAKQIAAANVQEAGELQQLGEQGLGAFDSLINTAQFLLDNATESQFSNRREQLITAINTFYDERLAFIKGLDLSDTDRKNMLAVADIQRRVAVEAVPQMHESVEERLELEKDLQDDITELRDEALENEKDRAEALVELEEKTQERILDIQLKAIQDREDAERDLNRTIEDLHREWVKDQGKVADALKRGDIDREEAERQIGSLARTFIEDSRGLQRERDRDLKDIGIREERQVTDVKTTSATRRQEIIFQAEVLASALRGVLAPLLSEQSTTETEPETDEQKDGKEPKSAGKGSKKDGKPDEQRDEKDLTEEHTKDLGLVTQAYVGAADKIGEQVVSLLSKAEFQEALTSAGIALKNIVETDLKAAIAVFLEAGEQLKTADLQFSIDPVQAASLIIQSAPDPVLLGDQREFHFAKTDELARMAGSQTARAMNPNPSRVQTENARDFANNFADGAIESLQSGSPKQLNATIIVETNLGDDQVIRNITKRQIELDQHFTNFS